MQPRAPRFRREERGMVLWMTIMMVLLLGGLSTAFLWESLGERTSIEHRKTTMLALEIAEMGAAQSTVEITALQDAGTDGIGNIDGLLAGGEFEVAAVQDANFPDRWKLTSTGTYRLSTKRVEMPHFAGRKSCSSA